MPAAPAAPARGLSFRTKLALTAVLLGVLPMLVASFLAHRSARRAVEDAVLDRLESVRDERFHHLSTYLGSLGSEVRTIAASPAVQTALPLLTAAWTRIPEELGWNAAPDGAAASDQALRALSQYYASQVAPRTSSDVGQGFDAGGLLPSSAPARAAQHLFLAASPHPIGAKHLLDRPSGAATTYGELHARFHPFLSKVVSECGYEDLLLVEAASGTVLYSHAKGPDFASDVRDGALKGTAMARVARAALDAQSEGALFLGDFEFYAGAYGEPEAFLACPIRADGRTTGALVVRVPAREIDTILHGDVARSPSAETFLVGADATMRTPSRFSKESTVLRKRISSRAVDESLAGRTGAGLAADYRGVESLVAYRPCEFHGVRFGLVSKVDAAEAFAPLRGLLVSMLVLAAVLAVVATTVGLLLARSLARPIARATGQLTSLAQGLLSTAQEQQAGAAEAAAAVEETRQTFSGVLGAAQNLRAVGGEVLANAEIGQRNAQTIGRRIRDLSANTAHITEILALVKEIANRSDLLALNAALEGTKAGEAGRGFSLVATQMQRLAEEVMGSVKKIEGLTQDITKASSGSVLAAEEAEKVATQTTASAQHIAAAVQQQQAGTEQVGVAMNEISTVAQNSVEASRRIVASSNELLGLAEALRRTVGASA